MKTELIITKKGKNVKLRNNIEKSIVNKKQKFIVGDLVTGIGKPTSEYFASADDKFPYCVTTSNSICKVIEILNEDDMRVVVLTQTIKHLQRYINDEYAVQQKYFELYKNEN